MTGSVRKWLRILARLLAQLHSFKPTHDHISSTSWAEGAAAPAGTLLRAWLKPLSVLERAGHAERAKVAASAWDLVVDISAVAAAHAADVHRRATVAAGVAAMLTPQQAARTFCDQNPRFLDTKSMLQLLTALKLCIMTWPNMDAPMHQAAFQLMARGSVQLALADIKTTEAGKRIAEWDALMTPIMDRCRQPEDVESMHGPQVSYHGSPQRQELVLCALECAVAAWHIPGTRAGMRLLCELLGESLGSILVAPCRKLGGQVALGELRGVMNCGRGRRLRSCTLDLMLAASGAAAYPLFAAELSRERHLRYVAQLCAAVLSSSGGSGGADDTAPAVIGLAALGMGAVHAELCALAGICSRLGFVEFAAFGTAAAAASPLMLQCSAKEGLARCAALSRLLSDKEELTLMAGWFRSQASDVAGTASTAEASPGGGGGFSGGGQGGAVGSPAARGGGERMHGVL